MDTSVTTDRSDTPDSFLVAALHIAEPFDGELADRTAVIDGSVTISAQEQQVLGFLAIVGAKLILTPG